MASLEKENKSLKQEIQVQSEGFQQEVEQSHALIQALKEELFTL